MNVIFTCGGTAGHINPAIAVADILKERYPDANILFIGAKGHMEEKLVPKAGYAQRCLDASGLSRGKNLAALKKNLHAVNCVRKAVSECKKIIREFQPDVIVGTGGYASFPALYAGAQMGIPTCVHESNALPGLTTKLVARKASRMLVAFEESRNHYKHPERVEVVGMPVSRGFVTMTREQARKELGLGDELLVVSAFGSQGAKKMNETMAEMLVLEQENNFPFRHIHATGSMGWAWMPGLVQEKGVALENCPSIDMREYIYNMPALLAAADVYIGRAGAGTCNEVAVAGTPAVLIPSPNVTDNHQEKNARVLTDCGAAVLMLERECTGEKLYETVSALLRDSASRKEMSKKLRGMAIFDSAQRICTIVEDLAGKS